MINAAEPDGRISSYRKEREFRGWDIWCRKYVLLGMQYFIEICKDDELKNKIIKGISLDAYVFLHKSTKFA